MYFPNARFYAIAGFAIAGVHCKPVTIPSPDASLAPLDASLAPHFKSLFWVGVTKPEELEKKFKKGS